MRSCTYHTNMPNSDSEITNQCKNEIFYLSREQRYSDSPSLDSPEFRDMSLLNLRV